MKHILFSLLMLPLSLLAQNIELQPAGGGKTTILAPTAGDTALHITQHKTIYLRPGAGGFAVGTAGSENFRVGSSVTINSGINAFSLPANRGTNGQVLTTDGAGTSSWATLSSPTGFTTTNNTALGAGAGTAISTGLYNLLSGYQAGNQLTTARYNTALGHQAMQSNINADANTAVGYQALQILSFNNSGTAYTLGNTAIGYQALRVTQPAASNSSGGGNTAVGYLSMRSNTTGYENTAVGHNSLNSLTTGYQNVAVGENAGGGLTTGSSNTFLGRYAGQFSTASNDNIFIGPFSASNLRNASKNIAIGRSALGSLSFLNGGTAWNTYNIAIGEQALGSLNPTTTAEATYNIGIGNSTLSNNSTGSRNIAIGAAAGANTSGSDNIFIGYQSGWGETGNNKLYIDNSSSSTPLIGGDFSANTLTINGGQTVTGSLTLNSSTNTYTFPTTRPTIGQALIASNSTGSLAWGNPTAAEINNGTSVSRVVATGTAVDFYTASALSWRISGKRLENQGTTNVLIGNGSGANATGTGNTIVGNSSATGASFTSSGNTLIGDGLGFSLTTGGNNTFIGNTTGIANTTGYYNIAIGVAALNNNQTGNTNVAIGVNALNGATSGGSFSDNTAIGSYALSDNSTGTNNTALGSEAGTNTTTGGQNTFIGRAAGYTNTTGSGNVFIGNNAGYNETGSNKLYIDNSATATPLIAGDFSTNRVTINGSLKVENSGTIAGIAISQVIGSKYTSPTFIFPAAFPVGVVPRVIITPKYVSGSARVIITLLNVTNTGFQFEAWTIANDGSTASVYDFNWLALE